MFFFTKFQYFNENVKYDFYQLNSLKNGYVFQNKITGKIFQESIFIFTNDLVYYKKLKPIPIGHQD